MSCRIPGCSHADSRCPDVRRRELDESLAESGRIDRLGEEAEHAPGGGRSVFDRCSYWEGRVEAATQVWEAAGDEMRQARSAAGMYADSGRYPTDLQRSQVFRAEAAWRAAEGEYHRCKARRDAALAELERWYR